MIVVLYQKRKTWCSQEGEGGRTRKRELRWCCIHLCCCRCKSPWRHYRFRFSWCRSSHCLSLLQVNPGRHSYGWNASCHILQIKRMTLDFLQAVKRVTKCFTGKIVTSQNKTDWKSREHLEIHMINQYHYIMIFQDIYIVTCRLNIL